MRDHIRQHTSPAFENAELEVLDILRWVNLEVDDRSPCDFESRFFSPCYDEDSGLEEEAHRWRDLWRETLDDKKHAEPEWVQNACFTYPASRARWFNDIVGSLQFDYDDEEHPMRFVTASGSATPLADGGYTPVTAIRRHISTT